MEIQPPPDLFIRPTNGPNPSPVNPSELLARLQPDQTLLAKVEKLLANNEVLLRIGNQLVRAQSPIPLTAGQSISLRVEESNTGNILRITQPASQTEVIAAALRTVLPKQQPIADVVKQLVQILANNKTLTQNTTPAVNSLRSAIQALVSNLPNIKTLSQANGLRQAIQNSGVNLESHLRQSIISGKPPYVANDIKANFLRIAQSALQLQTRLDSTSTNTTLSNNPISSSPITKTNSSDLHTALLNAAATASDKTLTANRPLLPPLPIITTPATTDTGSSISQRLIAALPPLLQRLLPSTIQQQTSPIQAAQQSQQASQQMLSVMLVELLNQMESGLARIQQHQLNSLTNDDVIRHFLGLELPVFNGKNFDNIGVRIEWEEKTDDESEQPHQWHVVLNFDFDDLGKVQVEIRAGKNEIHTDFKSESNIVQQLFQSHKEVLETGLRKHGLTLGNTTFSAGKIETQPLHARNENLVRTKV